MRARTRDGDSTERHSAGKPIDNFRQIYRGRMRKLKSNVGKSVPRATPGSPRKRARKILRMRLERASANRIRAGNLSRPIAWKKGRGITTAMALKIPAVPRAKRIPGAE